MPPLLTSTSSMPPCEWACPSSPSKVTTRHRGSNCPRMPGCWRRLSPTVGRAEPITQQAFRYRDVVPIGDLQIGCPAADYADLDVGEPFDARRGVGALEGFLGRGEVRGEKR